MNKKKPEPAFIPCGDSMEKITEIDESALEQVSGGTDCAGDRAEILPDIEVCYDETMMQP